MTSNVIYIVVLLCLTLSSFVIVAMIFWNKKYIDHLKKAQKAESERQMEMLRASVQGQEKERQRISENLHDDLGPLLSIINHSLRPQLDLTRIQRLKELTSHAITSIKQISVALSPKILIELGLNEGVRYIVSQFRETGTTKILLKWDNSVEPLLSKTQSRHIYRIIQEALNNLIVHSEAENCWIESSHTNNRVIIAIKDDGKGRVRSDNKVSGLGLQNMQARATLMNATIEFQSSDGFTIILSIPIND